MLDKTIATNVKTLVSNIYADMQTLNAYWLDTVRGTTEEIEDILRTQYPFELDFNEQTMKVKDWLSNIEDEVYNIVNCTVLVDSTNKEFYFDNSHLFYIKELIADNQTAVQVQDIAGMHRIIVFANNPILFIDYKD